MGCMNKLDEILESSNPAWEMFRFLEKYFSSYESDNFIEDEIQDLYNHCMEPGIEPIECIRKNFVASKWCCAVPSPEVLRLIATYSPLIEVGAGSGYWADQLHRLGANIIALDNGLDYKPKYFDVNLDLNFDLYSERTLLLIWPSDGLNWAYDLLAKLKWNKIIYIGEWRNGHMATSDFFDKIESDFSIHNVIQMHRYPGWKDSCYIFENKSLTPKTSS